MSYKSFSMELAGRTLTVDVGRVAAQANGAAFMHYGDTTVLSTATASEKPRDGIAMQSLSRQLSVIFRVWMDIACCRSWGSQRKVSWHCSDIDRYLPKRNGNKHNAYRTVYANDLRKCRIERKCSPTAAERAVFDSLFAVFSSSIDRRFSSTNFLH